jgi:hypothetical protein
VQQPSLEPAGEREQDEHEAHDDEDERERLGGVVGALREREEVFEPARRGDELANGDSPALLTSSELARGRAVLEQILETPNAATSSTSSRSSGASPRLTRYRSATCPA